MDQNGSQLCKVLIMLITYNATHNEMINSAHLQALGGVVLIKQLR